jgi:hypothetical protein
MSTVHARAAGLLTEADRVRALADDARERGELVMAAVYDALAVRIAHDGPADTLHRLQMHLPSDRAW